MACDEATFLQRRHVPKQRCAAHLAFVRQPLCAWVALAGFLVVEIRQLDQHNLGGGL
jgi:tryptophan-rich sensory protein